MTINPIIVQTGGESWVELIDSPPFGVAAIKTFSLPPEAAAGVTSIDHYGFYGCISLESVDIPAGVTSIGESAFYGCTSLASIDIPAGVTSISYGAFSDCSSLASVTLPAGLTSIGSSGFYGCASLASIEIPAGVTSISDYAFSDCSALMTVDVLRETPPTLASNSLLNVPATCAIRVPAGSVNAYKAAARWSARAAYITALP